MAFIYLFFKNLKMCLLILEREKNTYWLPPTDAHTGDQTHNLGMCLDQEPNLQPFGAWNNVLTK